MIIISSQAFKPGRVKLKEIGFDLYPTKVAGFFYVFVVVVVFSFVAFWRDL